MKEINTLIESSHHRLMSGKFWYAVLAGYVSVLGFLSLNPWIRPTSTDSIFSPDKFDHAIAYGGLVIIVFSCFARFKNRYINSASRAWIAAWLVAVLVGILIEIAQSLFTTNRSGEVGDEVANAMGTCVGYVVYQGARYVVKQVRGAKIN